MQFYKYALYDNLSLLAFQRKSNNEASNKWTTLMNSVIEAISLKCFDNELQMCVDCTTYWMWMYVYISSNKRCR